jgi:hypothetical protein
MVAAESVEDCQADAIAVGQHVCVPESQHPNAAVPEVGGASGVITGPIAVLSAIHFDDKVCFGAEKIRDVWTNRDLAAPLPSAEPAIAQRIPQAGLGVRVVAPKAGGPVLEQAFAAVSDDAHIGTLREH